MSVVETGFSAELVKSEKAGTLSISLNHARLSDLDAVADTVSVEMVATDTSELKSGQICRLLKCPVPLDQNNSPYLDPREIFVVAGPENMNRKALSPPIFELFTREI